MANYSSDHVVSVLLGKGDGTFQAARSFGVGTNPYSVAVGDFNGDGMPDLVVNGNDVSVLINNTVVSPVDTSSCGSVSRQLTRAALGSATYPR